MSRVGVFGGSFDPPHGGHVHVARSAADQLNLDTVLWIPARHSPFKSEQHAAPAVHRIAMAQLVVQSDARFKLDCRELERPGPSYTVDTLRSLQEENPASEFFLLVGEDSYTSLSKWKSVSDIRKMAQIVVYRRGMDSNLPDHVAGNIDLVLQQPEDIVLNGAPFPCGSTEIRNRISKNKPIDHLVDAEVATYIKDFGLYKDF